MKTLIMIIFAAAFAFVSPLYALDLSGKVTDIQTSQGRQNIKITVVPDGNPFEELEAVTGAEGFFTVSGLKNNAKYTVKAQSGGSYAVSPKSQTVQTSKTNLTNYNFAYYPKYSVSGAVSSDKIKTSGLTIMFKSGAPFYDTRVSHVGENGRYNVSGLIYGQEYRAYASSDFYAYAIAGDDSILISDNNVKDMTLIQVFYGTGKVFDSVTKKGLPGVAVKAVSADGMYQTFSSSSADGSFILSGLYYGENYCITVQPQPGFEAPDKIKTGTLQSTVTDLNFSFKPKQ